MTRVAKKYELTYKQEQVVVAFLKGKITGASAARRLSLENRQSFVNMFASIVQQWHEDGVLMLKYNRKDE